MRILAVADKESKSLYDYYRPGKLDGYDLILACGDLSVEYLEFLVTMADCPLVYVHGNHDEKHKRLPTGCICADDKLVVVNGLRILGFKVQVVEFVSSSSIFLTCASSYPQRMFPS